MSADRIWRGWPGRSGGRGRRRLIGRCCRSGRGSCGPFWLWLSCRCRRLFRGDSRFQLRVNGARREMRIGILARIFRLHQFHRNGLRLESFEREACSQIAGGDSESARGAAGLAAGRFYLRSLRFGFELQRERLRRYLEKIGPPRRTRSECKSACRDRQYSTHGSSPDTASYPRVSGRTIRGPRKRCNGAVRKRGIVHFGAHIL